MQAEFRIRFKTYPSYLLPWNNLSGLQSLPKVLFYLLVGDVFSNLLLHSHLPPQNFLVSETAVY